MADISRDDVLKLARLTHLSLSEDEVSEFQQEFIEILKYVEQLKSADVDGLRPSYQVTGLTNVMRKDEIVEYGYKTESLMNNAPARQNDLLKVKRMVG